MTAPLRTAADLTRDDVHAVEAFLEERIDRVSGPAALDSDAYRVTVALRTTVVRQARSVLVALVRAAEERVSGGDAALHRAEGRLVERWNLLMESLSPWEEQPGWDAGRWVYLTHGSEDLLAGETAYDRGIAEFTAPNAFDRGMEAL